MEGNAMEDVWTAPPLETALSETALSAAPTREATPDLGPVGKELGLPSLQLGALAGDASLCAPCTEQSCSLLGSAAGAETARQAARVRELGSELSELAGLRLVSDRQKDECPVCLVAFEDNYPISRAAGAFECRHDVCFACSKRLLINAVSDPTVPTCHAFRCPLCRAHGCVDRDDGVHSPRWLQRMLMSEEVVEAQALGARLHIDQAPMRIQFAARTAAEQIAALQRLISGGDGGGDDADFEHVLEAMREASEVEVEVVYDTDEGEGPVGWAVYSPSREAHGSDEGGEGEGWESTRNAAEDLEMARRAVMQAAHTEPQRDAADADAEAPARVELAADEYEVVNWDAAPPLAD